MKKNISLIFLALTASFAFAEGNDTTDEIAQSPIVQSGDDVDLNEFIWINRPLVVFADSPADPRFIQQMAYITSALDDLAERDVVVLTDTDPATKSALRKKLHPRGFMLVLIGKDGTKYLRKPFPWDVREISRVIDKLPLRQQELRDRRNGP